MNTNHKRQWHVLLRRTTGPRGFSLVEVLVAMTLAIVVMGIVVTLIRGLMQWDVNVRIRNAQGAQLDRLADDIRAEIRRGSDVTLDDPAQLIVASEDGRQTQFELTPDGCQRSVASDPFGSNHEFYAVGDGRGWEIERTTTGRRTLVTVTLQNVSDNDPTRVSPPLVVVAVLGADHDAAKEVAEE